MPAPVMKRNTAKEKKFQEKAEQIQAEGDVKHLLAAETVGEPAEDQRADDRAGDIAGGDRADIAGREMQGAGIAQHPAHGADDRHFQPIEHPGDAEGEDQQNVKAAPGQAVEPGRDIGFDGPAGQQVRPKVSRPGSGGRASVRPGIGRSPGNPPPCGGR
jgi:hypothetical protein